MDKFPITSKNGNTYMIEILEDGYVSDFYYVIIFQEKLNWRKKLKFKPVYGDSIFHRKYDGIKYGFNFVKMAQTQVEHYELLLEEERQRKLNIENGYKGFEEWNGICK